MMIVEMLKLTFQDCGDCLKKGSRASAQCRNSDQTRASLKKQKFENNDQDFCFEDGDSSLMMMKIKTGSPAEK